MPSFTLTSKVKVKKDRDGKICKLNHPQQPYSTSSLPAAARAGARPAQDRRAVADEYLREVLPLYSLDAAMAANLDSTRGLAPSQGPQVRFTNEKVVREHATISYEQTYLGLPVWEAGITVRMRDISAGDQTTGEVTGSQSSVHRDVQPRRPADDAPYMPDKIDAESLARLFGLDPRGPKPTINDKELLIYRYDADNRGANEPDQSDERNMHAATPTLALPDVPEGIQADQHYVVVNVMFTLTHGGWDDVNWSAFIEPETGAVLFLRAFVGCIDGFVYAHDPVTTTGNTTIFPTSPAVWLDAVRDRVTLDGLDAPHPAEGQQLTGEFVRLTNISAPHVAPPTEPQSGAFFYTVPSDDFSAVNAYHHCDRLFRMMEEMGFDVASYFDGTSFPVRVDHRATIGGMSNTVNATAPGNTSGTGSDGFRFALIQVDTQVGIAIDWRVVLHEFGHTLLWDNVNSPNFRFSHSAGDSLAAILNDVETRAPDPGRTFPWTGIARRHDHEPSSGYAWGGVRDDTFPVGHWRSSDRAGYQREQILSSTLFRLYRAIGGGHADVEVRRFASRLITYLVFDVIGSITPFAQPADAEDFAELLMDADTGLSHFEGHPGGTIHKVIRWAFERQGLYQPAGTPTPVTTAGQPPAVDVYIDDGRGGEYTPAPNFVVETTEIWCRRQNDGRLIHESPVAGKPNSVFVNVQNRGTGMASNVHVRLFSSQNTVDPLWPDDWNEVGTANGSDVLPGGSTVFGPIDWTPDSLGAMALLASVDADDDGSNIHAVFTAVSTVRLVHCDNNLAIRLVHAIPENGGAVAEESETVAPNLPIPDNDPGGVSSTLTLTSTQQIARIAVTIDIQHTYIGDLKVKLVSPAGTQAVLHNLSGRNSDDIVRTYSDDMHTALAAIRGETAAGDWRLEVADVVGQDVGTIRSWGISVELAVGTVDRQSNPALAIPDARPEGVTDEIEIDVDGNLASIAVEVKITHTYIGDLRVILESPGGIQVPLHEGTGGTAEDLIRTYTRDNKPALGALQGEPIHGKWTLHVADLVGLDVGELVRWGLKITTA